MDVIYTDGACSGNPGPGGWAWVEVDGAWRTGFDAETTNQRMELEAVIGAVEAHDGALRIVSDSTYVVNCWRDRWWEGWLKRGWVNSQRKPVANRDLWERLVPHFRDRGDLELVWVKGHSGDRWNDVADRLAVAAVQNRAGSAGSSPPTEDELGDPDAPTSGAPSSRAPKTGAAPKTVASRAAVDDDEGVPSDDTRRSAVARARDGRVPPGFLVVVAGAGSGSNRGGQASPGDVGNVVGELTRVIDAWAQMHPDTVVLSGLREGAEATAAEAARSAGVRYVAVLPYPDPAAAWPRAKRDRFETDLAAADSIVTLEKNRPDDTAGRSKALTRRDGWLRGVADQAVILRVGGSAGADQDLARWTKALGDDVWTIEVT